MRPHLLGDQHQEKTIGSRDQGKFSHPRIRISVMLTMEKIVVMASIMVLVSTTIQTLQVPILFITKMGIIIVMIIINIKMKYKIK